MKKGFAVIKTEATGWRSVVALVANNFDADQQLNRMSYDSTEGVAYHVKPVGLPFDGPTRWKSWSPRGK